MTLDLFDLSGKVAIVTGSSRGLGYSIAEALIEHGATVVVSSENADDTAEAAAAPGGTERVEAGMLAINHFRLTGPETPFGGVKDSGYGSEGGIEGIEGYLNSKLVSEA